MLQTRHIGKYTELLVLFTKYGRKDFRLNLTPDELLHTEESDAVVEPNVSQRAKAFADALKKMGPTFIKFGQLLSTRPDIVPPEYIAELESLQDSIDPFSFADVERIVEEELKARISKIFEEFAAVPIAAASLGQVHRAMLRDGREVVVKVQRPNVREQVRHDMEVFGEIAATIEQHSDLGRKMNLVGAIEQAKVTLTNELNYQQEARNSELLRVNLAEFPELYIPQVVNDMSSSRVLTTELVRGKKVSKLSPLQTVDRNYADLAAVLTRAYLKQICVDGFWHSDPHPGNVFIREVDENAQVVLLDFGMVSRISSQFQDEVIKLLLAVSSNRGAEVAEACVRLSEVQERFEPTRFVREISSLVANFHDVDVRQINVGQLIFNVIGIANNNELKVPAELAMLAKTLLHLDGVTRKLDKNFNPQDVIRDYSEKLIGQKLKQKFEPRNFYPALMDLNQLVLDFPHRAREIIDLTAAGKLSFSLKLQQAEEFLSGMHKIANRITVGIVIAALLMSSTFMMRYPTRLRLFGYPALAIIGYLLSAGAAAYLITSTFLNDRRAEERAKMKAK
ncbi:MAG: AarF/UbiB family protein [Thermoanaerobaculia bacterium]